MRIRKKILFGIGCLGLISIPQSANAQLFKKIGQALEAVDKALDGGTSSGVNNTQSSVNEKPEAAVNLQAKQGQVVNGVYQANLYSRQAIMPHPKVTSNTKVFTVNSVYDVAYSSYSDGALLVRMDKKFFFVDTLGNKLIDYPYGVDNIYEWPRFSEGVCPVSGVYGKNAFLINKAGKIVKQLPVPRCTNFVDGVAAGVLTIRKGYTTKISKVVYFNTKGEQIYPELTEEVGYGRLESLRPFSEGLAAHLSFKTGKYGFRNKDGKLVIPATYNKVQDFSDGLAAVQTSDRKWGFIDKTGKMVIEPKFSEEPSPFKEGYAVVQKRDLTRCFIDKNGQIVYDGLQDASPFHNGKAYVRLSNERYGLALIDKNFKVIVRFKTDLNNMDLSKNISYSGNDILVGNCFVTEMGDMILGGEYMPDNFSEGLTYCKITDPQEVQGFINRKGEYVFIFKESEF